HLWFGDMVTPAWWNDTWLNEGFADWAGGKIVGELQPRAGRDVEAAVTRAETVAADALGSVRAVRQPIVTEDDIENAFDYISYEKGEAVLRMLEAWLGPEPFRAG